MLPWNLIFMPWLLMAILTYVLKLWTANIKKTKCLTPMIALCRRQRAWNRTQNFPNTTKKDSVSLCWILTITEEPTPTTRHRQAREQLRKQRLTTTRETFSKLEKLLPANSNVDRAVRFSWANHTRLLQHTTTKEDAAIDAWWSQMNNLAKVQADYKCAGDFDLQTGRRTKRKMHKLKVRESMLILRIQNFNIVICLSINKRLT